MSQTQPFFRDYWKKSSFFSLDLFAEFFCVVRQSGLDDFQGFVAFVDFVDEQDGLFAGDEFVGAEIMMNSLDENLWEVGERFGFTPDVVVFENGDDFVIGFAVIDHLQAADYFGVEDDFASVDGSFTDDADVERIAITTF